MPDVGGLLTAAVVKIAADKLGAAIGEQASLLCNFSGDLGDMRETLESISAVLEDAERRSVMEQSVRLWLKRLKHAAYDISDIVDDYRVTKATAEMPRLLSCFPIARKKIVLANKMKSMRERLRKINEEKRSFTFTSMTTCTTSEHKHYDPRETASYVNASQIIGRDEERKEIINILSANENKLETMILPIYGLGGMGKSTLAQLVCNDAQFKKYDHRVWAYVSQDFDLMKIGSSIISQVQGSQQNINTMELINQHLDVLLPGKKILIVLDDIWVETDFELQKLKDMLRVDKKDSMLNVIVTTRKENIAKTICTNKAYKLQPLDDYICWGIIKRSSEFEDKASKGQLEQIGLDIARKCGGVALAAKSIGYTLKSKDLNGWSEINNSDIWNGSSEDEVLPSLKLSYERMPQHLRLCFSYCAIFSKGHNITEDDLIHQWISLDFIDPSKGKKYMKELLGMCFLQHSKLASTTISS